eukprot:UN08187
MTKSKVFNTVQQLFGTKRLLYAPEQAQIALRFPIPGNPPAQGLNPGQWHLDGMNKRNAGNFLLCGLHYLIGPNQP